MTTKPIMQLKVLSRWGAQRVGKFDRIMVVCVKGIPLLSMSHVSHYIKYLIYTIRRSPVSSPKQTGFDFFAVWSGLFESHHSRQPVAVAVRQNRAKKPD